MDKPIYKIYDYICCIYTCLFNQGLDGHVHVRVSAVSTWLSSPRIDQIFPSPFLLPCHTIQQSRIEAEPNRVRLDVILYNSTISAAGAGGGWRRAFSLLKQLDSKLLSPTVTRCPKMEVR